MALDQNALDSLRIHRDATPPEPTRTRRWLPAVVITVIVLLLAGWWWRSLQGVEVSVTEVLAVSTGGGMTVLDASGYVVARRQATVSAKVTGKVQEVLIEEGMSVKAGQVLATLDASTTTRQLELAQQQAAATRAELAQVQVRLAEAQRTARRTEQLRNDKLVSEAELDAAQSTVAALQAQLDALRSQVNVANANIRVQQQALNDLTVRAPFAGVVISKDAQPGEMVSPISAGGGYTRTGIATLVDMDSREIEVDVNEAFINRVSDGQKTEAVLDAYPQWIIPSHVISIVPTADRQKATVKVRIGFDQLDPRILPDMGVKVRFLDKDSEPSTARTVLQVPTDTVVNLEDKSYVWRLRDAFAERTEVTVGNERSGQIDITQGLAAGDVVVMNPDEKLRAAQRLKVRIKTADD